MSGKGMTRREFLRGSAGTLLGAAAFSLLGFLSPEKARAAETAVDVEAGTAVDAAALMETSVDSTSLSIVRDTSKCIGCGKCVEMCTERQGLDILQLALKNGKMVSSLKSAASLSESACIGCGQCARHCPSGAITVKDSLSAVAAALGDSSYRYIVWQFAPSAQHIIGEEFRELTGTDMSKKLAAAVRKLDSRSLAFSTDFGADITIMEEATECVNCFRAGTKKPFMTSCCPGWVNYVELTAPDLIPHLSSCKSPMEMLGSLIKSYLPEQKGVQASELFHVAVMPCTAKKYERSREEMSTGGVRSVDAVLTVVEFKNLLMSRGIDLTALADGEYDSLFAGTSGAGRIFGATGGVCEAAMRTAYYLLTNQEPPAIDFTALRGNDGLKTAEVNIGSQTIRACVVNGIGNIKTITESIRNGTCPYDFIEVMACRGGCSGGGGTPVLFGDEGVRHRGLYRYDAASSLRSSHLNRTLSAIYTDYLTSPCSEIAESLLHTSYHAR
ncbi:MAG: iron hydrogenase small subunit [Oscillibacter sp.]|nr:iron hydrogenase small subunit [Oscillibacter sp.]